MKPEVLRNPLSKESDSRERLSSIPDDAFRDLGHYTQAALSELPAPSPKGRTGLVVPLLPTPKAAWLCEKRVYRRARAGNLK